MSDDGESKRTRFEWWLEDLSTDPATRVAGAVLIIFGSILGVMTGSLHITADIGEVLSGQIDDSGVKADVNGAVFSALIDNSSGGDGMEDVTVVLYDDDGLEIGRDVTDSGGRFYIEDVPRKSSKIVVEHPDHIKTIFATNWTNHPGDGIILQA